MVLELIIHVFMCMVMLDVKSHNAYLDG